MKKLVFSSLILALIFPFVEDIQAEDEIISNTESYLLEDSTEEEKSSGDFEANYMSLVEPFCNLLPAR